MTVTGTVTEWAMTPLVPVTWTEKLPEEVPVTVSVAVPEPVMLVGFIVAVIPDDAVVVSETIPVKPLRDVTVIVDVPEVLGATVMPVGLAEREKSGVAGLETVSEMVVVCESEPLVPVMVIV